MGVRTEELLSAVSISVSELVQAAGRFESDTASMVRASVDSAGRAFAELDACDAVIDRASEEGAGIAQRVRRLLGAEAGDVPAQLDALAGLAEEVRRSRETRRVINRVLGRDEIDEAAMEPVPRLTEAGLPVFRPRTTTRSRTTTSWPWPAARRTSPRG